jgi:hypothetical protein
MNKTRGTLLSLVLAVALLLPMAPARAAGEIYAKSVELTANTADRNFYVRSDHTGEITLTAAVNPADYNGTITWSLDDLITLTPIGGVNDFNKPLPYSDPANRTLRLRINAVTAERVPVVSVSVQGDPLNESANPSAHYSLFVHPDTVESVILKPETLSLEIGKTAALTATAAYMSKSGTPTITYSSSNPAVATVNAAGVVTGVAVGKATIAATAGEESAETAVTVTNPSSGVTVSATLGQAYSMQSVYEDLLVKYSSTYRAGADEIAKCQISFYNFNNTYGTLKNANGTLVESKPRVYTFPEVRTMFLDPYAAGSYVCSYIMTDSNGTRPLEGTINITISTPTTHIRIPVSSAGGYAFSSASQDAGGKSGAALIRETVGTFGSIRFGAVQTGANVGTLYTSINTQYSDIVVNGTVVESSAIESLYFTPANAGAYCIEYEAFSGPRATGALLCRGTLIIPVDSASLDVTVNLETVAPYLFSAVPYTGAANTASATSQLLATIDKAVGVSEWNGIRFTAASGASTQVGTLYPAKGSAIAIGDTNYIDAASIANLYFVPNRIGTYEIQYSVYTDARSNVPLASGKLTLNVSTVPSGNADFIYTLQAGETIALKESDFVEFYKKQFNSRFYLSSVVFDDFDGNGVFLHDGQQRFTPRNSTDCFTSTYKGTLPAYPYYIDRLTFTAPNASGYTSVRFTCFGGPTPDSMANKASGVLHIYYTDGEVPIVSYNAYNVNAVNFSEQDFVTVYQSAMKSNTPNPSFEIRLVNVPNCGDLYRYYSKTGSTKLTDNTLSAYSFWVNGSETDSISRLSYVPGWSTSESDTVSYLAFSQNGSLLFAGMIRFVLEPERTARTATIYTDGLKFQARDFYTEGDRDPVTYVTFPTPESGKFYVYNGSRYIQANDKTQFYVSSATEGSFPITNVLYVPKAIQSGNASVTIKCIAHRRSGAQFEDTINLTVFSRNASTTFSDVTANSFGWASNSVDFARLMGIVGGTGNDAAGKPIFSPEKTMLRCHMILMLYRLDGRPTVSNVAMPFTDIPAPVAGDTYSIELYNSALWAYANGIVQNVVSGNVYDTKAELTRQEFAQILCNYYKHLNPGVPVKQASLTSYSDASQISSNTLEGVAWAVANGYITSASSGMTIEPTRAATRAEIVTLLHRYLTY